MFSFAGKQETFVDTYRRDGVTVIKGVFAQDETNEIRSAAYMILAHLSKIGESGYKHRALETIKTNGVESPALIFWSTLASEPLNRYRTDERLQKIVTAILGPNVKQLNNQLYYRLPGDGDSFAWHQDIMFRSPRIEYPGIVEQDAYLQTAIIVDRMWAGNGGIEFVLGSHRLGDIGVIKDKYYSALRGFDRNKNAEKFRHLPTRIFEVDPGDVLVWSSLSVHGSEPNKSGLHRMYYMNGFAKAECCNPWPYYVKDGKLVDLDPSMIP